MGSTTPLQPPSPLIRTSGRSWSHLNHGDRSSDATSRDKETLMVSLVYSPYTLLNTLGVSVVESTQFTNVSRLLCDTYKYNKMTYFAHDSSYYHSVLMLNAANMGRHATTSPGLRQSSNGKLEAGMYPSFPPIFN